MALLSSEEVIFVKSIISSSRVLSIVVSAFLPLFAKAKAFPTRSTLTMEGMNFLSARRLASKSSFEFDFQKNSEKRRRRREGIQPTEVVPFVFILTDWSLTYAFWK